MLRMRFYLTRSQLNSGVRQAYVPLQNMATAPRALPPQAVEALDRIGFVVLPGPLSTVRIPALQAAYDAVAQTAAPEDVRRGRSSTRITDFVTRDAIFDEVYTWPPALDAARHLVGGAFRLSAFHARTLHPDAPAQELHVDIPPTSDAWPMLGLILMVDAFRDDNGATRFIPGSHHRAHTPAATVADPFASQPNELLASGPAGSVILFNASVWHGHTANSTTLPRRSLQATFIPLTGRPATDFRARMRPEVLARLTDSAREILGLTAPISAPPV